MIVNWQAWVSLIFSLTMFGLFIYVADMVETATVFDKIYVSMWAGWSGLVFYQFMPQQPNETDQ